MFVIQNSSLPTNCNRSFDDFKTSSSQHLVSFVFTNISTEYVQTCSRRRSGTGQEIQLHHREHFHKRQGRISLVFVEHGRFNNFHFVVDGAIVNRFGVNYWSGKTVRDEAIRKQSIERDDDSYLVLHNTKEGNEPHEKKFTYYAHLFEFEQYLFLGVCEKRDQSRVGLFEATNKIIANYFPKTSQQYVLTTSDSYNLSWMLVILNAADIGTFDRSLDNNIMQQNSTTTTRETEEKDHAAVQPYQVQRIVTFYDSFQEHHEALTAMIESITWKDYDIPELKPRIKKTLEKLLPNFAHHVMEKYGGVDIKRRKM